ncbi:5'-3' exonuclease [Quadrisphaera sp. DSM 44207]|uniref:5'-3' exonuclease n=1 Tax=Quadrisphaera sp. DSM 44207 TaxID=1881057 RepID=UPI00087E3A6E|nr:5'-3' exonuclease [Quadrisphaera sp. DSM 44207]SDQ40021.1 5'-3' exonuclease [Quadrisphaera sp. DSM 44207]
MLTPPGRLVLLDAATLYFRAFHALPSTITAPDGTPVGAVRGFLDMVAVLVDRLRPGQLVAGWDEDWRPAWRVELIPSYKAHRVAADGAEEVPEALGPQVELIAQVLAALGVPRVGAPGCEADDVLGVLATRAAATGTGADVVSGDRDLLQLVDDAAAGGAGIRVVYIGRGVRDAEVVDAAALAARYGLDPARAGDAYADLAVLRGDPSDGLPGVAGIGEKTAAALLARYGDLPALLCAVDRGDPALSPTQRRHLLDARDYLTAAPRVVRVLREADVPALPPAPPSLRGAVDDAALDALAQRWGLRSSVDRVLAVLAG